MIAEVIVDVASSAVDKIFEYIIPANLSVQNGDRVVVPFGPRKITGYVLNIKENASTHHKLKEILSVKPDGKILPEMLELCKFMVEKYNIKQVDALRLFLTREVRTESVHDKLVTYCKITDNANVEEYVSKLKASAHKQIEVLQILQKAPEERTKLNKIFGASAVNTLIKNNIVVLEEVKQNRPPQVMATKQNKVTLNADQQLAVNEISKFERQTYVLFGVTGSGKTEVYMNTIENALQKGKTAILLVPEISLTPQVFGLLTNRFGNNVAILHSGLSAGERFDEWKRIEQGKAKVVVGARSAIFAPVKNVGVIIVDEEHESSYNSETNPRYKTEDIALFRAQFNNCPFILGSATPSVETFQKTVTGEYKLLKLPKRVHKTEMPQVQLVDMVGEIRQGNSTMFSNALLGAIFEAIQAKQQVLLFINRRGYTSFMRCTDCGYVAKCTDCDAPLVYHKDDNFLKCHFCGKKFKPLTVCPECNSQHIRQGAIGTQKVVDEISKLFPSVPIFRMDNDTTSTKNGHQKILEEFSKHNPAILVGTQMIAKGHDFSNVQVVGVLDADQTLYQSDYKSAERTFQLITQVAGRAGRKKGGGKVFLQTYNPRHFVYRFVANYNYSGFFDHEINIRETTNFPPFSTILRILIANEKEDVAYNLTKQIFDDLKPLKNQFGEKIIFFNAMKSPHTRLKNKFRFQVLMRFTKSAECDIIKEIYKVVNKHLDGKNHIFVEINPSNLS